MENVNLKSNDSNYSDRSIFSNLLNLLKANENIDKVEAFSTMIFNKSLLNEHFYLKQLIDPTRAENDTLSTEELIADLNESESEELDRSMVEDLLRLFENKNIVLTGFTEIPPPTSFVQGNEQAEFRQIEVQFQQIVAKLTELFSKLTTNETSITRVTPELRQLLQQWITLEKQLSPKQLQSINQSINKDRKEESIIHELINTYKKRVDLIAKRQYNTNAQITNSDIAKWLRHALSNYSSQERVHVAAYSLSNQQLPMSDVEQYIIFVNRDNSEMKVSDQILKQFEQTIRTSQFLTKPGMNQLTFSLRPEKLGEMMVRLTQINGEMAVKIIVSSQATKEMLESNIHQLKNMFSPHNVLIEKEELSLSKEETNKEQNQDQQLKDDEKSDTSQQSSDDEEQTRKDFKTEFLDSIMNEKV